MIPKSRTDINSTSSAIVLVNKVDHTIHEGDIVKLVFDYEQDAYGCQTVVVLRTGTDQYPYLTIHLYSFHQPIDIPYYAVKKFDKISTII